MRFATKEDGFFAGLVALLALLIIAVPLLIAWGSLIALPRWENWHTNGAGLHIGMRRDEILRELNRHSRNVDCANWRVNSCGYEPGGLARWAYSVAISVRAPKIYRIDFLFDEKDGKLQKSWTTTYDND